MEASGTDSPAAPNGDGVLVLKILTIDYLSGVGL